MIILYTKPDGSVAFAVSERTFATRKIVLWKLFALFSTDAERVDYLRHKVPAAGHGCQEGGPNSGAGDGRSQEDRSSGDPGDTSGGGAPKPLRRSPRNNPNTGQQRAGGPHGQAPTTSSRRMPLTALDPNVCHPVSSRDKDGASLTKENLNSLSSKKGALPAHWRIFFNADSPHSITL